MFKYFIFFLGPNRASPSHSKAAPFRKPTITPSLLGKRTAAEISVDPAKRPRVLGERNQPVVVKRPVPRAQPDANKGNIKKKIIIIYTLPFFPPHLFSTSCPFPSFVRPQNLFLKVQYSELAIFLSETLHSFAVFS